MIDFKNKFVKFKKTTRTRTAEMEVRLMGRIGGLEGRIIGR